MKTSGGSFQPELFCDFRTKNPKKFNSLKPRGLLDGGFHQDPKPPQNRETVSPLKSSNQETIISRKFSTQLPKDV